MFHSIRDRGLKRQVEHADRVPPGIRGQSFGVWGCSRVFARRVLGLSPPTLGRALGVRGLGVLVGPGFVGGAFCAEGAG
jgi:hypothetical protein